MDQVNVTLSWGCNFQKLGPLPVRIGGCVPKRGQRLSDHCGWLRRAAGPAGPAGLGLDTVDIVHRYR